MSFLILNVRLNASPPFCHSNMVLEINMSMKIVSVIKGETDIDCNAKQNNIDHVA